MAGTRRTDFALPVTGVLGATSIGIGVALLDPRLAGSTAPHPTLTGSLREAVWVLQNNARVLAVPFLLVAFGFPERRLGRRTGDLIVPALVAASAIPVGLALGRWGTVSCRTCPTCRWSGRLWRSRSTSGSSRAEVA